MSNSETTPIDPMAERLQHLARWLLVATLVAVSGLGLGGISLAVRWSDLDTDNHRQDWDVAYAAHNDCVVRVNSRQGAIETGHADFDREEAGIDRDAHTVELISAIISLGNPESEFVIQSLALIGEQRAQVNADRDQLAVDRANFDATRPPLDLTACPKLPAGPRP
jgi:hypothetical protein